jgi:DNA-binding transcriptional LysR family regulator
MLSSSSFGHIRTFLVVASELHFTRAGEILHLAQPSVTDHVRRLEEDLGVQLFHRHSRRVELTPVGRRFAARMTDVVTAFDRTVADLTSADAPFAPLRVGLTPAASAVREPVLVAAAHAGALAILTTGWEADLLADLRTGRQAIIVGHALPTGPDVTSRYLLEDPLRVLLPDDPHPGTPGRVRLADLADHHLIAGPADLAPRWHARITDIVRAVAGSEPTIHHAPMTTTNWSSDVRAAVQAHPDAYALMPASSLPAGTTSRSLDPPVSIPLLVAWLSTTVRADVLHVAKRVALR